MQLGRCPVCHSRISLEQVCQDDAGRELLAELARLDSTTGVALVSYLGLFRSGKRDLANDRALKLAREALALEGTQWLTPALQETVEAIRTKRNQGEVKPLANHNYLKAVLNGVIERGVSFTPQAPASQSNDFRSLSASQQRLQDTDW